MKSSRIRLWRQPVTGQAGLSMTEGLVGIALLSIGTLAVAYLTSSFGQALRSANPEQTMCVQQINTILSALRSPGLMQGEGASVTPTLIGGPTNRRVEGRDLYTNANQVPGFINRSNNSPISIFSNGMVPPLVEFNPSGGGNSPLPVLSGASALRGSVRLVEHLYNLRSLPTADRVDFCTNDRGMTQELQDLINLAATPWISGDPLVTRIRIRPYNQLTGRLLVDVDGNQLCPAPLTAPPMSGTLGGSAFDDVPGRGIMARSKVEERIQAMGVTLPAGPPPRYIGYQVDVETRRGNVRCNGSSRFEYQRYSTGTPPPSLVAIISNNSMTGASPTASSRRGPGNSQDNRVQLLISATASGALLNPAGPAGAVARVPPGTVMLCRDRSQVPDTRASFACYGGDPGPGPQRSRNGAGPLTRVSDVSVATARPGFRFLADIPGVVMDRTWQPCESVTLCGRRPSNSNLRNAPGQNYTRILDPDNANRPTLGRIAIENTYRDLRADCIPAVEVRLVNAAGNVSNLAPELRVETAAHQFRRGAGLGAEVARNTCGSWCPVQGNRSLRIPYGFWPQAVMRNDGYRIGGQPRQMRGFAPAPMPRTQAQTTDGAGGYYGYYQTGGCCVSPLPPAAISGNAGAVMNFTQNHRCRPGWRYENAGTAANPAVGARVRLSNVAFSTDDSARPRVNNLDNLNMSDPSLLPWNDTGGPATNYPPLVPSY